MARASVRSFAGSPPAGDLAEHPVRHTPRLLGRYPAVSSQDEPPVARFPAAAADAVVDEIGLDAGGLNADTEACEPVVPGEP